VISRKAFELADLSGFVLNGFSAAAQRVAGGCLTALLLVMILALLGRQHSRPRETTTRSRAVTWLLATTICGPVLGVSTFQWSLLTLPAGITTAITATTPVAMIPLVMWLDRERPPLLSVAGSCVAVAGVILMVLARA
jgi:drug/metabolite transporter (DMT)-like permease